MKKTSRAYSGRSARAKSWKRVGKTEIIFEKYGKKFVRQNYINPKTKKAEDFYFLDWPTAANILPITSEGEVVTIKEFFHGPERVIRTLPGGNLEHGEKASKAIQRELLEETGYKCQKIISLSPSMFYNTRHSHSKGFYFLGLGARKVSKQKLDDNEDIKVETLPLKEWLRMCHTEIVALEDIVMTFKALKYFDFK